MEELKEGLKQQGSAVTQNELQALVASMDFDANGSIDYDEFLAATINMSQLQARSVLLHVFPPGMSRVILVQASVSHHQHEPAAGALVLSHLYPTSAPILSGPLVACVPAFLCTYHITVYCGE